MARKFYRSGQFMLTLKQLEWLNLYGNKSQVIRVLIDLAMNTEFLQSNLDVLLTIDEQITKHEKAGDKIGLEEWQERRKKVLAKLI